MVMRAKHEAAPRVAVCAADPRTAHEVSIVAKVRGIELETSSLEDAVLAKVGAIGWAPGALPEPAEVPALAALCRQAAEAARPVVILAGLPWQAGKAGRERAAILSMLSAHGAIVTDGPDTWFETLVLLSAFGAPPGPRAAIVAPPWGWLHLEAIALSQEQEARGAARTPVRAEDEEAPSVDVVLVDPSALPRSGPRQFGPAWVVPVRSRAELLADAGPRCLVGLRAALAACGHAGRHAERIEEGLGPAPLSDLETLEVHRERAQKALSRGGTRLGDHESKLLLSAYGVVVTRQGVADTPSAAVRIAQTCGFPVEVKAWEPQVPMENEGTFVVRAENAPEVRRAFAQAPATQGLKVGVNVIVRVMPPAGRNLQVRVERHPHLGWMVFLESAGLPHALSAPAPLRRADALALATAVESSRAGDKEPDRGALAELLRRASFAAVDNEERVSALELGRVVAGSRDDGAVVADVRTHLHRRR